jgi:hypothetical protein
MPIRVAYTLILIFLLQTGLAQSSDRWSVEKANEWYARQDWLVGANFSPSTAINQLEMWQAPTFDTITINRELGWAHAIGMNTMRVFLHHVAWQEDPKGFKERMNIFLNICAADHIKPLFVFFDDCWNPVNAPGKQPEPKPGTHNSGWVQDPGQRYYEEPLLADTLEHYVKDILGAFGHDQRILLWDLYNECGGNGHYGESLDLLKKVFTWARASHPDQPLSSCYYSGTGEMGGIDAFILSHSDVITYHSYEDAEHHQLRIDMLKVYERPLLCTEYMARKRNSTFFTILPLLKAQRIAAINWGLVDGKTQTKYAWDEPIRDGSDPKPWFHEVFHKDGEPYRKEETDLIRSLTLQK